MNKFERSLYNYLSDESLVSKGHLAESVKLSSEQNIPFYKILLDNKYIEEDNLLSSMSRVMNLPVVNLKKIAIDEKAVKSVPVRFAWHYEFMPVKSEGNKLTVAVNIPLSLRVQDEIRLSLGKEIRLVLAKKEHITELLKTYYGLGADTVGKMVDQKPVMDEPLQESREVEDIEKLAETASVIKLVNQIIIDAYHKRATDIHIEPFRGKLRLRYRIDGVLYDQNVPPNLKRFLLPILSRIKIMANLNIVEHRLPQDGRAVVKVQEQVLDLRVSFMPTNYGESVVIRILPTKMFFRLEQLGLSKRNRDLLEELVEKPNGIIFVTGPTGSGKTTTLYACLERINKREKKVITLEDPVEYEIADTLQIQVNPEIGLTFARGLRSILRHDPDIMMVGEVRDKETADIAIRVSLTGHLIFSTLHTNDSSTGVTRLIDIGVPSYLVASSVEAFIAQRLVRVICPNCRTEDKKVDSQIESRIRDSLDIKDKIKFYRGKGCEKCNYTGFYGRTGIYEILVFNAEIKQLVADCANAADIKKKAMQNRMLTLIQDGWLKVVEGVTTPEEVLKVCQDVETDLGLSKIKSPIQETKPKIPPPDLKKGYSLDSADRRVYMRLPKKISVRYKLVEKGEGKIVKIGQEKSQNKDVKITDLFAAQAGEQVNKNFSEEVFTTTVNISAGGMVFESNYLIPVDSILELLINLTPDTEPIRCLAKVIRVEKNLPKCFNIAVCYLDLSGGDRNKLNDFVKKEFSDNTALDLNIFGL